MQFQKDYNQIVQAVDFALSKIKIDGKIKHLLTM